MPLPKPSLDTRRFDQLVAEGRALIPRLAPQWTDHNASDPGITLLELGAWLSEQNIYRFDVLSQAAMRAFVRLVGVEPLPPGVATTTVALRNSNAAGMALPARIQLASPQAPRFETTTHIYVSNAALTAVRAGKLDSPDLASTNEALSGFAPFGAKPRPQAALYLGFDRALDAPDATLSLHVWTDHWQSDIDTARRLQTEAVDFAARCPPGIDWRLHYRVRTVWEFHAGGGVWQRLDAVEDETRALTLSGFVRFKAPSGHAADPGQPFFIRCRIVRGRFECAPRILHVACNAVQAEHALSRPERRLGVSRGHAGAEFTCDESVVSGTLQLRLDNGAGDVQTDWRAVPDFDRAGPHDRVFVLDPERGELRAGDGLRAAIWPAGYEIWAAYRAGGNVAGNIDARTLTIVPNSPYNLALAPTLSTLATPLDISQPFAALGGTPAESLAAAQARAFDLVNAVDKAVTLEDFERLALQTPGVPIARVRAVPNLTPELPCYPAPGSVTLIAIPSCPARAPLPSRALLDAVERYLQARRLVTSEVRTMAPRYRRISVNATLHLACDVDRESVLASAHAALDRFLDPLHGGPNASGWEFGRTVYRSELLTVLATTPGVTRVSAFSLRDGYDHAAPSSCKSCSTGRPSASGRCDNIELCVHELVRPGRHRLTLQTPIVDILARSDAHECG